MEVFKPFCPCWRIQTVAYVEASGDHQRAKHHGENKCKSSHWRRTHYIWISPRKWHSSHRFFSGFTSYPRVLDTCVSANIVYIYVCKTLGSGICSMCREVWFKSLLYLFCSDINDENCGKTSFSCNWRNPYTSIQPFWIWQIKRLNATGGSMK